MQEYGIQVSDSVGQRMNVYFMPMSYIDWVKYSDAGVASSKDPSVVRYLLKTYITRTFTNEYDNMGTLSRLKDRLILYVICLQEYRTQ